MAVDRVVVRERESDEFLKCYQILTREGTSERTVGEVVAAEDDGRYTFHSKMLSYSASEGYVGDLSTRVFFADAHIILDRGRAEIAVFEKAVGVGEQVQKNLDVIPGLEYDLLQDF